MWAFGLGNVLPWLLAASSKTKWETPRDMSAGLRELYVDLEQPGPRHKSVTPNIFFSYVTPPTADGITTWTTRSSSQHQHHQDSLDELDTDKPIALLLPGLDGYGISSATNQFDDLAKTFEFWRMAVLPDDRSSFVEIVNMIVDFAMELSQNNTRKVTLIGESCGGLLAAAAAIKLGRKQHNPLQGLVLGNPATSFDRTAWDSLVPLLTMLPSNGVHETDEKLTPYAVIGSLTLSALIPDNGQRGRIFQSLMDLPTVNVPPRSRKEMTQMWDALAESFRGTERRLPAKLLQHRVTQWLDIGDSIVNGRLQEISVPTLIVVGEEDKLMPSAQEAKRLNQVLKSSEVLAVKGRGHFVFDDSVNLTEAILYSKIDPLNWTAKKPKYDPILDWKPPSPEEARATIEETIKPLRDAFSPVFFSTDKNGKVWKGTSKVPEKTGPLLFVGNHQLFGVDLRLAIPELYEQNDLLPRGLAHPIAFFGSNTSELMGRTAGLRQKPTIGQGGNGDFQMMGAVLVTPRNYYRLMQTNQTAILFPGGAREALTGNKSYPLYWPEKVDFVRTAARFNATIVPLSAIGMAESATVLADYESVGRGLPFLASRFGNITSSISGARYDSRNVSDLVGDLVVPSLPSRNYFLFGKSLDTSSLDHNDIEACQQTYNALKSDVRKGLDDLIEARKKDHFANTPRRVLYERTFGKQAPTFPVEELNNRRGSHRI